MSKKVCGIITVLAVVFAAAATQADMIGPGSVSCPTYTIVPACAPYQSAAGNLKPEIVDSLLAVNCSVDFLQSETPDSKLQIRQLPAAPDSAVLYICALGTLGVWPLTRSVRKLHLANVPPWFHTGAPYQIGHTHVLVPDFLDVLPICCFDRLTDERRVISHYLQRQSRPRCETLYFLPTIAPRPPPLVSS